MSFTFESRASDAPFVDMVWKTQSSGGGLFLSTAETHWEMVITKQKGLTTFTVRGPETRATPAPIPNDAEFFGIVFKLGTFMPHLPTIQRVNADINLPELTNQSFWLLGAAWQFPTYDNADTFISRMVREGLLVYEPLVEATLHNQLKDISLRSVQRRFLRATGLTHSAVRQIDRARHAVSLLQQGTSILDTVEQAGYSDQPHLTRSLRQFFGQTPVQIAAGQPAEPTSI